MPPTPRAAATATQPAPTPTPVPVQYALIGKARGPYWNNVERGAKAAEQRLGLPPGSVVFYAPEREDAAAQVIAVEHFIALNVRGIAIAPSSARALELSIRQARDAGVWVTTFDSDAPDSQRLFFVGTPQGAIGSAAAAALIGLAGDRSGKVALGSTLLDGMAAERIRAFKEGLRSSARLSVLDAANDGHDPNLAAALASAAVAAHADLVGAYGVYAYNSLAWCRAVLEAGAAARTIVIGFDLNAEAAACLKAGAIDAVVVPRDHAQGLQSVLALDSLARRGLLATAAELKLVSRSSPPSWVVDVGVDVVSPDGRVGMSLADYARRLNELGIPRDWAP